jgi:hypothetical protein
MTITCANCDSQYDVYTVGTKGWPRERADASCEVCGTVLVRFDPDYHPILVLTKRGHLKAA